MSTRPRVLVTHPIQPSAASLTWLESQGVEVVAGPPLWERPLRRWDETELIGRLEGCAALVLPDTETVTRAVIEASPALRCIAKYGIGFDNVDVEAATEHGILVTNTPESDNVDAVCEHTIALMLATRKRLDHWTLDRIRDGEWRDDTFSSLVRGSTVGIIGFGRIGRGVAHRLSGWGVRILAHDPYVTDLVDGVDLVDLDDLLKQSDIVAVHAAASSSDPLIDQRALDLMKRSAVLINTSRGSLVDQVALARALSSGGIAAAGLDVLATEPPAKDDPLLGCDNLVITPHVAAWTTEGLDAVAWRAARNVVAVLTGQGDADIVNPALH